MIQLFEMSKHVGVFHSHVVLNEIYICLYIPKGIFFDILKCENTVLLSFQLDISLLSIIEARQVKRAEV